MMLALRAGQRGHVSLHQRRHDLQAGTHGQRQQALAHILGDLAHRHTDPLWNRGCARVDGLNLVTLLHGGPLAVGVLGGTPDTYHTAGIERGTATSTSARPGTTSDWALVPGSGSRCSSPIRASCSSETSCTFGLE